jgi:hypothetical protein
MNGEVTRDTHALVKNQWVLGALFAILQLLMGFLLYSIDHKMERMEDNLTNLIAQVAVNKDRLERLETK